MRVYWILCLLFHYEQKLECDTIWGYYEGVGFWLSLTNSSHVSFFLNYEVSNSPKFIFFNSKSHDLLESVLHRLKCFSSPVGRAPDSLGRVLTMLHFAWLITLVNTRNMRNKLHFAWLITFVIVYFFFFFLYFKIT